MFRTFTAVPCQDLKAAAVTMIVLSYDAFYWVGLKGLYGVARFSSIFPKMADRQVGAGFSLLAAL